MIGLAGMLKKKGKEKKEKGINLRKSSFLLAQVAPNLRAPGHSHTPSSSLKGGAIRHLTPAGEGAGRWSPKVSCWHSIGGGDCASLPRPRPQPPHFAQRPPARVQVTARHAHLSPPKPWMRAIKQVQRAARVSGLRRSQPRGARNPWCAATVEGGAPTRPKGCPAPPPPPLFNHHPLPRSQTRRPQSRHLPATRPATQARPSLQRSRGAGAGRAQGCPPRSRGPSPHPPATRPFPNGRLQPRTRPAAPQDRQTTDAPS